MSKESQNFLQLFKEKKYSEILFILENEIQEEKITSGLLNLSGVCRMMSGKSNESINLFNDLEILLKETDKNNYLFKNLVNASLYILIMSSGKMKPIKKNFFDEIISVFHENKELFENNHGLVKLF